MIRQSTQTLLKQKSNFNSLRRPTSTAIAFNSGTHRFASTSTLIIAEPTAPSSTTLAPATLSSITAALKLHSGPITLLNSNPSLDTTQLPPSISTVLNHTKDNTLAETISSLIVQAQKSKSFTHIIAPATKFGSNVIPRAAAMMDVSPVLDVIDILSHDTFIRPMYAGNALAKVQSTEGLKVLSIRSTAFEKATIVGIDIDQNPTVEELHDNDNDNHQNQNQTMTQYISSNESSTDRPDLSSASIVVSGGRGLKDGQNFQLLYALADKLNGAAVGASRAAVDAGFVPNDMQVGQTGKVVAPDLYIAVGISGAIQVRRSTRTVGIENRYTCMFIIFMFIIGLIKLMTFVVVVVVGPSS